MGYYMIIAENNLKAKKDLNKELDQKYDLNELYLPWRCQENYLELDEDYFKWNREILRDFLVLRDMGVRGHMSFYGEEGEYYKYVINRNGVKEYYGRVVYPKKPKKIYRSKDDVKNLF